ncbi:serine acetyltransferase [Pantoea sp. BIGb0393]|uniref:Serine acetyltransferase n=1 Tax=Pantoea nemavictus TaxID=2726955 RepID=A0ABU8PQB4_9GAMM|nr:serine acetyltransferase [Pantoea nemavictus]MBA0035936.1 serine acetyltransferase [Pantoea nemavictus]
MESHIEHLKECLKQEVMKCDRPFSWVSTIHRAIKCPDRRLNFWWRLANYLYVSGKNPGLARKLNRRLLKNYGIEIQLGARIGKGLRIAHSGGINISHIVVAGENLLIRQNTTIGAKLDEVKEKCIRIGDNVDIGANSCIIGSDLRIGDNVTIGAMSFINKDIPDNCTAYNKKVISTITLHHKQVS